MAASLAVLACVTGATALAGRAAFANGTLRAAPSLADASNGRLASRLEGGVPALAPGDRVERTLELTNASSVRLGSIELTTAVSGGLGRTLRLRIDRCPRPWGRASGGGLACDDATTTVLASAPFRLGRRPLVALGSLAPGEIAHLRLTVGFAARAGNVLQRRSAHVAYAFAAAAS